MGSPGDNVATDAHHLSPHRSHNTSSGSANGDDAEEEESQEKTEQRDRMMEELDRLDPRQGRVLYSHNDSQTQQQQHAQPKSLDDYGSRRHFMEKNYSPYQTAENSTDDFPYLIVGGSDGSGTRAMVDTLINLGVFFHVEDRKSMDIHGGEMFHRKGWPPLVELAVKYTHSANYNVSDLPPDARAGALHELKRLKRGIDRKVQRRLVVLDKRDNTTNREYAVAAKLGWKAPISMLLMPLLREVFGRVKYLHVVRDGRDISISDNQSPVKKFYNTIYGIPSDVPPADKDINALSMQLWNDMNQQAAEWGKSNSDGETFDYLMVRSEDLVNPETKFETLLQLADFVGSRKTTRELCCLSQTGPIDMGKSANGFVDPRNKKRRNRRNRFGGGDGDHMEPYADRADAIMDEIMHGDRRAALRAMRERMDRRRKVHGKPPLAPHDNKLTRRLQGEVQHDKKDEPVLDSKEQDQDDERANSKNVELPKNSRRRLLDIGELFAQRLHKLGRRGGREKKEAPEQVKARYGKWQKFLEDKPDLSQQLHQLGAASLRDFGYEPPAQFLDPPDDSFLQQCQTILSYNFCREGDGKNREKDWSFYVTYHGPTG